MRSDRISDAEARNSAKRAAKDSIFRDLFQNPEYLLQLYQALHPEDKTITVDDIELVSIQNVLLNQMYNDLGFLVGREQLTLLILLEVQSTWSINILIRILLYLANTLKEYIEKHKFNVYGSKKLKLPKAEFYVIYTGESLARPEWLSLADEYFGGDDTFLNLKVRVIYNGVHGDIINQYVTFTKVYDEQIRLYGRTRKAVLETIKICRDKDVLKQYLESRQKEAVDIMMTLFDQDYAWDRYVEEFKADLEEKVKKEVEEEVKEEGKEEGKEETRKTTALNMRKKGFSNQDIADILEIETGKVERWFSEESPDIHSLPQ